MAKISDFGNTWGKFFCRGETHAVHLAWPPSPLHVKNGQSGTASRKFFQHADRHRRFLPSRLNVQIRAFWKPISKIFCWCTVPSIVFRGYYPHTGSSPFLCPSISTWRKSAILETPEQIFLPGRNSRCTFSQTPLTPTWEKSGKLTPPLENFFQHADCHRRFLPSLLNV